jgi:hypothetical protein
MLADNLYFSITTTNTVSFIKDVWSCTFTPTIHIHGMVLS